jgi:hypothetical protein
MRRKATILAISCAAATAQAPLEGVEAVRAGSEADEDVEVSEVAMGASGAVVGAGGAV